MIIYILIKDGSLLFTGHPNTWGALKTKANIISSLNKLKEIAAGKSQEKAEAFRRPLVGINIIPNSDSIDLAPYLLASEYEMIQKQFIDIVDYFVINLTGPSKEILLEVFLGEKDRLEKLLDKYHTEREYNIGVRAALLEEKLEGVNINQKNLRDYFNTNDESINFPQILIKIDNTLNKGQIKEIARLIKEAKLDGVIFEPVNLYTTPLAPSERRKENEWISNLYKNIEGKI